jgi:hypothetical protein
MSLAEIKTEVRKLTRTEREELVAHIETVQQFDDPEWLESLARARDRMEAGHVHTEEEVLCLHEELIRQGR